MRLSVIQRILGQF